MSDWVQRTQIAANIATTLGVMGLAIAYMQFRGSAKAQRDQTAVAVWNRYLELALSQPTFAMPSEALTAANSTDADAPRYRWYVSSLLFACEHVLALHPGDKEWEHTVKVQLCLHWPYLAHRTNLGRIYSGALVRVIGEVVSTKGVLT